MEIGIRNSVSVTCEGCFKKIIYEKDEDSGVDCIQVDGVWMQLCEECAEPIIEKERRYMEDEQDDTDVRYDHPEL
ncbi:MAG: hypothetical protein QOG23_1674 [Blastocatellia bacterium]|nr:hypothetical protein [Blastocatellia bacterium]